MKGRICARMGHARLGTLSEATRVNRVFVSWPGYTAGANCASTVVMLVICWSLSEIPAS
jgi:hypothetical protein